MREEKLLVRKKSSDDAVIALVGNPNVGKSTLFNALTGKNQHTGNWPGKTVDVTQGRYEYKGKGYILVDLPGAYSLISQSEEEQVTADFLSSGQADCVLVVADGCCLERNLTFVLQIMDHASDVMLCVNLLDEAEKKEIFVDIKNLRSQLGVPVCGTSAGSGEGLAELRQTVRNFTDGFLASNPIHVFDNCAKCDSWKSDRETELICRAYAQKAKEIYASCVKGDDLQHIHWFDRIALGKWSGALLLLLMLFGVFWLTAVGANYPSALLQMGFDYIAGVMRSILSPLPTWLLGILLDGIYATTVRVISVMLPPMLIFYPLFTLLEDIGYLPRVAFMTDHLYSKCGSCGKQALTMSLGFGCNAVGVMGCRIISSPKERLLAILTNALVPCNGRFPALIALAAFCFPGDPLAAACLLTSAVLLSIVVTFLSTAALGKTILRGKESNFIMEMPPYRKPNLRKIISSAIKERTLFVLLRAVMVSAPTGALIWCLQNASWDGVQLIQFLAQQLEPLGILLGMNGVILLAFVLSFPANELLIPMIVAITTGSMSLGTGEAVAAVLIENGWTGKMALCTMLFLLFHWPCSTTCLTIYRETRSLKWTAAAILVPTMIGMLLCMLLG